MMFRIFIGISLLFLAGCGRSHQTGTPGQASYVVESFTVVVQTTTMPQLIGILGKPTRDAGVENGAHVYGYHVADGSEILVGAADDPSQLVKYVKHDGTNIFVHK